MLSSLLDTRGLFEKKNGKLFSQKARKYVRFRVDATLWILHLLKKISNNMTKFVFQCYIGNGIFHARGRMMRIFNCREAFSLLMLRSSHYWASCWQAQ